MIISFFLISRFIHILSTNKSYYEWMYLAFNKCCEVDCCRWCCCCSITQPLVLYTAVVPTTPLFVTPPPSDISFVNSVNLAISISHSFFLAEDRSVIEDLLERGEDSFDIVNHSINGCANNRWTVVLQGYLLRSFDVRKCDHASCTCPNPTIRHVTPRHTVEPVVPQI